MTTVLVEACVESVAAAVAAERAGAGRIELCADLAADGTTPSAGTIAECRARVSIPIYVMIRPRGGDFVYDATELAVMRRDIAAARELGADGVVLGALTARRAVDPAGTRALVEAARPLDVTFHKAIDATRDPLRALDELLAIGVDRVLTSGRAKTACAGARVIAALVERAAGRVTIMAGGGVAAPHAKQLLRRTGVRELHARATDAKRFARLVRAVRA